MGDTLLIAAGSGIIFSFDIDTSLTQVAYTTPNNNEYFMGLSKHDGKIIASTNFSILEMDFMDNGGLTCLKSLSSESLPFAPMFQHIRVIGNRIFATAKSRNSIFIVDFSLLQREEENLPDALAILTLKPTRSSTDYNEINTIFFDNDKYLVNCHTAGSDNGDSGIVLLDKNLDVTDRIMYGWNTFGLSVIDDKKYVLCNIVYNKGLTSGLAVETDMKIHISPEFYCMDFAMNDDFIFIVGTTRIEKGNLHETGGILLKYDRDFKYINSTMFTRSGQFMGCMLVKKDLTNELWRLNDEDIGYSSWEPFRHEEGALRFLG